MFQADRAVIICKSQQGTVVQGNAVASKYKLAYKHELA